MISGSSLRYRTHFRKVRSMHKKAEPRRIIVVCDKNAKSEVGSGVHMKKVKVHSYDYPSVRRNMKIQRAMKLQATESALDVKARLVTSSRAPFTDLEHIYGHRILQFLRKPEKYEFKRSTKFRGLFIWNVIDPETQQHVMETDTTQEDHKWLIPQLEEDIGVLKRSVDQLLAKKSHDVIALNTHPGHHAGPTRSTNYCVLNNIAIAASLIKKRDPRMKVGVIDVDVHPGDGTQEFYEKNRHLLNKYVSIHCSSEFFNMNSKFPNGIAMKCNKEKKVVPHRFNDKIREVMDAWRPGKLDVIIVCLGFDTLKNDPVAGPEVGFEMLPKNFECMGRTFAERPEQVLFIQEGGYNATETAHAFEYLMKGFRDGRTALEQQQASPKGLLGKAPLPGIKKRQFFSFDRSGQRISPTRQ